jgi:uncharacterized protein
MESLAEGLVRIAELYRLRDVYAFGSRAREVAQRLGGAGVEQVGYDGVAGREAEPASDLDVGVQPQNGASLSARDRVRLSQALEELFGAPRVDLVLLSEASSFLALEVVRGELLYTADPLAQAEHELYVLRRAADLAPLWRARAALILEEGGM